MCSIPRHHTDEVQIRIEGTDLPGLSGGPSPERPGGHQNNHVGIQRKGRPDELLGVVPGDAPSATWILDCSVVETASGPDVKGPYVQGPPGGRFIYLNWGVVDDDDTITMFRRAKLMFDGIPQGVLQSAVDLGTLVGRLGLTDAKSNPPVRGRPPAAHRLVTQPVSLASSTRTRADSTTWPATARDHPRGWNQTVLGSHVGQSA
jgi:hypothetical protein